MAVIFLESKDNAKIKHLRGLIELNSARKKHQQTVLEGTHLCLAWLQQHKKSFHYLRLNKLSIILNYKR
jgi:TrmH family RNA methyltransferase